MIDNPLRLEAQRKIADLERRREQLLVDRTPLHPAVQEVEGRLADAKAQLAAIPRKIADEHVKTTDAPAIVPPPMDEPAVQENRRKLDELTATLKNRPWRARRRSVRERGLTTAAAAPQFIVEYAEVVQNPAPVDYGWRRLIWTTFAASILMVCGIASISLGAGIKPPVATVDEVEADLGQPVIGTLPTEDAAPDIAAIHRQATCVERRSESACC